jgi:hypothetical protein
MIKFFKFFVRYVLGLIFTIAVVIELFGVGFNIANMKSDLAFGLGIGVCVTSAVFGLGAFGYWFIRPLIIWLDDEGF